MTFQKEYKSFLREIDFTKKKVQFVLLLTVNLWVPFRINNKLMEVMFFFLENLNCENFTTPCVSFCEKISWKCCHFCRCRDDDEGSSCNTLQEFFFESLKIDNKDNILLESRERDENEISFLSHTHSTLQK